MTPTHQEPAPRVVRLYQRATAAGTRAARLAGAVTDGLFLGLMDRDALAALDAEFYARVREPVDGVARRYDEPEHIRGGLHPWERAALAEFPPGGRVVVTGAGAGREVLGLLAEGFDAHGYEPNSRLVAAGGDLLAREGHPGRLHLCARDHFPTDAGAADGVVVGWGSYMLVPGRERRVAFLAAAREHLAPGGPLLLSFFVRPPSRHLTIVHAVSAAVRRLRGAEPSEPGDALSPNYVHYFTRTELAGELADAGFACVAFHAEPYGHALARVTVPRTG